MSWDSHHSWKFPIIFFLLDMGKSVGGRKKKAARKGECWPLAAFGFVLPFSSSPCFSSRGTKEAEQWELALFGLQPLPSPSSGDAGSDIILWGHWQSPSPFPLSFFLLPRWAAMGSASQGLETPLPEATTWQPYIKLYPNSHLFS